MKKQTLIPLILVILSVSTAIAWRVHEARVIAATQPARNADGTLNAAAAAWSITNASTLGHEITFTDTVTHVHQAQSGQWYLNFGGKHPNAVLGVWVPKSHTREKKRAWFASLAGQLVTVTGTARHYKGRPEIHIRDIEQDITPLPHPPAIASAHGSPTKPEND